MTDFSGWCINNGLYLIYSAGDPCSACSVNTLSCTATSPNIGYANKTIMNQIPNQTSFSQAAANQTSSSQAAANQTSPSQAAANQTSSNQSAANQSSPNQAAANQTSPNQAAANQTTSGQAYNMTTSQPTTGNEFRCLCRQGYEGELCERGRPTHICFDTSVTLCLRSLATSSRLFCNHFATFKKR